MCIILSIEITHLNINNFIFISGVLVIITDISNKTSAQLFFATVIKEVMRRTF